MRNSRRALVGVLVVVLATGIFFAGWWAARTALEPPRDTLITTTPVLVTAEAGAVEQSLALGASGQWRAVHEVRPSVDGTVTSIAETAGSLAAGDTILTIDLAPLVVAEGEVPAFRSLGEGTTGPDVAQLEQLLIDLGHLQGDAGSTFDAETTSAVRAWQEEAGLPLSGDVPLGTIVFVDRLPATVRVLAEVGDRVAPGDTIAEVLADAPDFRAIVTEEQLAVIDEGTPVELNRGDTTLTAVAGPTEEVEGATYLTLVGGDGPVCSAPCEQVPTEADSRWAAQAQVVPRAEGVVLPVAAVRTLPDGERFVVDDAGAEVTVTTGASASGQVVVSGLDAGTRVQMPYDE